MKILYLLGFMPPYVTREIETMATCGHEVSVLLPEEKKNNRTADFWKNISTEPGNDSTVIRKTMRFNYLTCPARQLVMPLLKSLRFFRSLVKALKEGELRYFIIASSAVNNMDPSWKPDVIHVHFALDQAHIARIMSSILQIPYAVTTHATDIFVPRCKTRLRRVLNDASRVFTISRYNVDILMEYGLDRKKIVISRLGLDTTGLPGRITSSPESLAVCTASGLVPKKGVPVLIEAMRLLQQMKIDCRLVVIGSDLDGEKLKEYRENSKDLPVEFTGVLNSGETLKVVSEASLFVLPCIEAVNGDMDGIPVALMEAMGMGIPCISTSISGVPELIENGVSGILVEPGSPEELSKAMAMLLSGKKIADRLGKAGREKVLANHSPEKQADILSANLAGII
ncbi:MAG: glycosyltransferase family 4 protein [Candidatus Sabulitectum sp.]|nr:glycosyltransferase family 4 protein [Candidatus Sabulitectum sp.]